MTELESAQQFRTATNICSQSLFSENSAKRLSEWIHSTNYIKQQPGLKLTL